MYDLTTVTSLLKNVTLRLPVGGRAEDSGRDGLFLKSSRLITVTPMLLSFML